MIKFFTLQTINSKYLHISLANYEIFKRKLSIVVREIGPCFGVLLVIKYYYSHHSELVCAYHTAVPGSNPKHTIVDSFI